MQELSEDKEELDKTLASTLQNPRDNLVMLSRQHGENLATKTTA
jgi:hypothetical protein